eukprot:7547843-Lingulodinium_polyedra.AAC.1
MAVFINTPRVRNLYMRALHATKDFRLPELCMSVEKYLIWVQLRYEQQGKLLDEFTEEIKTSELDWELSIGVFRLHLTKDKADMQPTDMITQVVWVDRRIMTNLPPGFHMEYKDIGEKWTIIDNYHSSTATLCCSTTKTTQMLEPLFAEHALVIRSSCDL